MTDEKEYTGGSVSYYTCSITHPINEAADPYDAECIDIIDALAMTPNEANAFKALWRRAAARLGKSKKGYTDGLYDAEKVAFYGQRLVEIEQRERRVAGAVQEKFDFVPAFKEGLAKAEALEKADPFGPRDADGWYTWNGDDTMRPAGAVDIVRRAGWQEAPDNAGDLHWGHDGSDSDIVKWRPAQEQSKKKCANAKVGCLRAARAVSPYCDQCEPDL